MNPLLSRLLLLIPDFFPGRPALNTFVRNALGYGATAGSVAMITWLNAKGWNLGWVEAYVPWIVVGAGLAAAAFASSIGAKRKATVDLVEHVLEAAATGTVPPEVKAVATPRQAARIADVELNQGEAKK